MGYSWKSMDSSDSSSNSMFNLLPVPQQVSFSGKNFLFNDNWALELGSNISKDDPAIQSLINELKDRFNLNINSKTPDKTNNSQRHLIRLTIKAGSVPIGEATDTNQAALKKQSYRLKLNASEIAINANASTGLFYGVQTLLQLLRSENEKVFLPEGEIVDWPDLELRIIHWDDSHHLERLEALKRAIRQAAYFKINAFALKLEGHFQYESAKPIVEPYALSPAEYQELTNYAKAHYVQLIPYLDGPAHVSFILKHPEYINLRAFPNSNYEFSVTNPKTDELLLGMFDNLMDANQGGQYILLAMDEPYYIGMSDGEKERAEALGGRAKLLAEFITRISNKLHEKGRTVITRFDFWQDITSSDINALPSHLVMRNYNSNLAPKFKQHGIRQIIRTAIQGSEPLFPNYYLLPEKKVLPVSGTILLTDDELVQPDGSKGNVGVALETISSNIARGNADFMGIIIHGWADSGLHPETFWLGYATTNAAVWNLASGTAQELTVRFFNSFYGSKTVKMNKVYQLLSNQAEFWENSWDWEPSKLRTPIFGNSEGIYEIPKPARDQTLSSLPVPSRRDLSLDKDWSANNSQRLQSAEEFLKDNNELLDMLHHNLRNVDYQHYNLQVMLSIAQLCRQNLNMLLDLQRIDKFLKLASNVASTNPSVAVSLIDQALDQAKIIRDQRNETLKSLTTIWYQDWYPRVAEANGRHYLDQVDDVKDHRPNRTVDMSYLIYRELHYPLDKWAEEVKNVRNQFAKENHLPIRTDTLNWENTEQLSLN